MAAHYERAISLLLQAPRSRNSRDNALNAEHTDEERTDAAEL
jgi:hypothetical protein